MNFIQKAVSNILGTSGHETAPSVYHTLLSSATLGRDVVYEVYLPAGYNAKTKAPYPLVLFNDGQDLLRMHFAKILEKLAAEKHFPPIVAVGIHASERRIREYGTAHQPDYKGRGDLAAQYTRFILEELLPDLQAQFRVSTHPKNTAFAGFSLGGLSALDIVWAHPEVFGMVGVFSGSLWWRSHDVREADPDADRIMIERVQKTQKIDKKQRFWLQCGTLDEADDRNHNGVIDSIDDTRDLIRALYEKGIPDQNVRYLEIENGRHEVATWGEAMPDFLRWVFGKAG